MGLRTTSKMNDNERKAVWAQITDPIDALDELSAHRHFIGDDPYYRDLDQALWDMVDRTLAAAGEAPAAS